MFNGNKRVNMQHAAACNMQLVTSDMRSDTESEGERERWQRIKIATFYWVVSCVKHMQILPHMYSTATPSNNNSTHTRLPPRQVILDSSRTPKKNLAASIAHMPALELRLSKPMRCWFPTPQRRLPPPATPPVPVPLLLLLPLCLSRQKSKAIYTSFMHVF